MQRWALRRRDEALVHRVQAALQPAPAHSYENSPITTPSQWWAVISRTLAGARGELQLQLQRGTVRLA